MIRHLINEMIKKWNIEKAISSKGILHIKTLVVFEIWKMTLILI